MERPAQLRSILAALACITLACSTTYTKVVKSWRDPAYGGREAKKVLVIYPTPLAADQKSLEYAIAERLQGAGIQPYAAYDVLPRGEASDERAISALVAKEGIDLVLTTKLVAARAEQELQPGTYSRGPSTRAASTDPGAGYTPMYLNEAQATYFETNAYAGEGRRLVWSGLTRTFDSSTIDGAVLSAAEKIVATLREQGVL